MTTVASPAQVRFANIVTNKITALLAPVCKEPWSKEVIGSICSDLYKNRSLLSEDDYVTFDGADNRELRHYALVHLALVCKATKSHLISAAFNHILRSNGFRDLLQRIKQAAVDSYHCLVFSSRVTSLLKEFGMNTKELRSVLAETLQQEGRAA